MLLISDINYQLSST